jgi:hypothetical protein
VNEVFGVDEDVRLGVMIVASKPERSTAHALLDNAVAPDASPEEVALSVDRAFAQLLVGLGRWVGDESARVLLERAVDEARARHPWLTGVRVVPVAGRCLAGLDERIDGVSAVDVSDALEELLAELIRLLARFIGDDLALRIVIRGWPAGTPASTEGESR